MSAPSIVSFKLNLEISTNDLDMLQQLADREGTTIRDLLIATLQGDLAHKAETLGLGYRRGWRDATRLAHLLQVELDHAHDAEWQSS